MCQVYSQNHIIGQSWKKLCERIRTTEYKYKIQHFNILKYY